MHQSLGACHLYPPASNDSDVYVSTEAFESNEKDWILKKQWLGGAFLPEIYIITTQKKTTNKSIWQLWKFIVINLLDST